MWRSASFRMSFAAALVVVAVAGCGSSKSEKTETSSSSSAATTSSSASASGGSDAALVTKAKEAIEELAKGSNTGPPPGPAAVKGKNVWAIACGLQAPGCSVPAEAIKEAAKILGWKLTIGDGHLTPEGEDEALKDAVTAKAEGVITIGMDCATDKSGFEAVYKAKIPLVAGLGSDCNEYPKETNSTPFVTKMLGFVSAENSLQMYTHAGELHADWAIQHTDGKAKIVEVNFPVFSETANLDVAFNTVIKECTECEVLAEKSLPAAALANPEASNVASSLLEQYPEATIFETDNDSFVDLIGQALAKANKKSTQVISAEGYPTTFKLIEEGYVGAGIVEPQKAYYWGTADVLNRIFAGEKPSEIKPEGYELGLVEKGVNLPPAGQEYETTPNYKEKFTEIWEGKNEG
jgi:ribose transport system substrate-binding protein